MRALASLACIFWLSCSFSPDEQPADAAVDAPIDGPALPVCGAQRTVAITPGIGSLAWFTLV